jgi:hypothetical protein
MFNFNALRSALPPQQPPASPARPSSPVGSLGGESSSDNEAEHASTTLAGPADLARMRAMARDSYDQARLRQTFARSQHSASGQTPQGVPGASHTQAPSRESTPTLQEMHNERTELEWAVMKEVETPLELFPLLNPKVKFGEARFDNQLRSLLRIGIGCYNMRGFEAQAEKGPLSPEHHAQWLLSRNAALAELHPEQHPSPIGGRLAFPAHQNDAQRNLRLDALAAWSPFKSWARRQPEAFELVMALELNEDTRRGFIEAYL